MNPRITPSSRAHTIAMWAMPPFVIHILLPFRMYEFPSLRATVRIPEGLLPKSASVSPKQPMTFPFAISGRYLFFCSSDPYARMGYMQSAPCTETKERSPLSPRSSSCMMRPYATLFSPAQRSEEHTSELQSQSNLVCRLLLEKKKTLEVVVQ